MDDRTTPTHSSLLDNKQVSYIAAGYGHSAILTAEVRELEWLAIPTTLQEFIRNSLVNCVFFVFFSFLS